MRDAVKTENYWMALIDEATARGYDEFCITMNPFPGVIEMTTKYLKKAKAKGMETNVTTVFQLVPELDDEFYANVDTLTLSIDDLHGIELPILSYLLDVFTIHPFAERLMANEKETIKTMPCVHAVANIQENLTQYNVNLNYNLLWTPKVFQYVLECKEKEYIKERNEANQSTVQHLFYKPISLYESADWFWEHFERVMEEVPEINILGTEPWSICDVSLKNHMGTGQCPGYEHQMVDFDPMGYARRCPENPVAHDATSIGKAVKFLSKGTPCQIEKCNCIFN
jgi:hypothetical protein